MNENVVYRKPAGSKWYHEKKKIILSASSFYRALRPTGFRRRRAPIRFRTQQAFAAYFSYIWTFIYTVRAPFYFDIVVIPIPATTTHHPPITTHRTRLGNIRSLLFYIRWVEAYPFATTLIRLIRRYNSVRITYTRVLGSR